MRGATILRMKHASPLELVVFDVAGTTVAASDDVAAAFRAVFAASGIDLGAEAVSAVRGLSKRQAVERLCAGAGRAEASEEVYRRFTEHLIDASRGWRPVPGARETFEWLRSRSVSVALTTGLDRTVLDALLDRLRWGDDLVDAAVCGDDVSKGRPAPDMIFAAMERCYVGDARRVAVIGDTKADLMAAASAGAGWSLGVSSGAHTAAELARCPHDEILESVADLPAWCEKRLGSSPQRGSSKK